MRWQLWLWITCWWLVSAFGAGAATGKLIKVLPQFIDQEGRHTLSPSLYERDAYQAYLRQHPEECSGMRFAVQWNTHDIGTPFKIRMELRGRLGKEATRLTLEATDTKSRTGLLSRWCILPLTGDSYQQFGKLTSWKASLLDGDTVVGEMKSFLWVE